MTDPDAVLDPLRGGIADIIAQARAFSAPAGSPEMRAVLSCLDYLGVAYAMLDVDEPNPAWTA